MVNPRNLKVPESDHEQRHGGATGRLTQSTSRWPRPVLATGRGWPHSPRPRAKSRSWHLPGPCGEVQCWAPAPSDPPASRNTTPPPAFRPGLRAPSASLRAALATTLGHWQAGPGRARVSPSATPASATTPGPGPINLNFPMCLAWTSRYDCEALPEYTHPANPKATSSNLTRNY